MHGGFLVFGLFFNFFFKVVVNLLRLSPSRELPRPPLVFFIRHIHSRTERGTTCPSLVQPPKEPREVDDDDDADAEHTCRLVWVTSKLVRIIYDIRTK